MRYAMIDLPLAMHKSAFKAAEASHCAGEQGKFWEMHQSMLSNQKNLGDPSTYAASIGLDMNKFDTCLKSNKYVEAVRKNMAIADSLGITVTPSFVIAEADDRDPSKIKGIDMVRGAQEFEAFEQAINRALAGINRKQ